MTKTAIVRFVLLWSLLLLIALPVAFFAGIGYFFLLFAVYMVVLHVGLYRDSIFLAMWGSEQYSVHAQSIIKYRLSRTNRIWAIVNLLGWFALAICVIVLANVRLVDLF